MLHGYHWIVPRADNKLLSLTLDIFGWLVLPTPMFIIGNVTAVTHSFKAEFNKVESCWPTTACFPFYLLNLKGLGCFSRLPESVNLLQCWINENVCLRRKHLVKRVSLPKKQKKKQEWLTNENFPMGMHARHHFAAIFKPFLCALVGANIAKKYLNTPVLL